MAAGALRSHPLSDVVARLRERELLVSAPQLDPQIQGVVDDSRYAGVGDLFCAWRGTATDSHRFLSQVQGAGAAAALVERAVPEVNLPQVVVTDGRRAAAVAATLLLGDPSARIALLGVTGTNGKTTTVWMLRHLLGGRYRAGSIGTLGVIAPDGRLLSEGDDLTTPGPVGLARTLRALVEEGADAVAMEASSHALDQGRLHAMRFDVAVFTNLSRDHLDYHGTEAAYREAKLGLIDLLDREGIAVLNADDPAWTGVEERASRRLTYGLEDTLAGGSAPDVQARGVSLLPTGCRFRLHAPAGMRPVRLPLVGAYNVQNALAATAACLALGIPIEEVVQRLETMPQVPGRLERIANRPCPVLRDYAHTPDALRNALAALRPFVPGRLIVVFGAGGDRDRGKRPQMGAVAEAAADVAIVTSDNPRTEDPDAIIDEIVAGMTAGEPVRIPDRRRAIGKALELARAEDLVLLAGKGHETYQVVGADKLPFDEREVVRALLGESDAE